jgi:hypothetical protein
MIKSPLNLLNGAALLFGGALTLTVAATQPAELSTAVAASGGLLAGSAAATELSRKEREKKLESQKVARAFTALYAKNMGMLIPQELAFESGVDIKRIEVFLESLAENQGGQKAKTEQGTFYKFPHPENVLDQLTANATAWARSQADALVAENTTLKQQVATMQAILMQMPAMPKPQTPTVPKKENAQESVDPWTKLL